MNLPPIFKLFYSTNFYQGHYAPDTILGTGKTAVNQTMLATYPNF